VLSSRMVSSQVLGTVSRTLPKVASPAPPPLPLELCSRCTTPPDGLLVSLCPGEATHPPSAPPVPSRQMAASYGELLVTVKAASDLQDCELFGEQDPFVVLSFTGPNATTGPLGPAGAGAGTASAATKTAMKVGMVPVLVWCCEGCVGAARAGGRRTVVCGKAKPGGRLPAQFPGCPAACPTPTGRFVAPLPPALNTQLTLSIHLCREAPTQSGARRCEYLGCIAACCLLHAACCLCPASAWRLEVNRPLTPSLLQVSPLPCLARLRLVHTVGHALPAPAYGPWGPHS